MAPTNHDLPNCNSRRTPAPHPKRVRLTPWLMIGLAVAAGWFAAVARASADDWPQWLGPERDGVWRESGIVTVLPDGAAPKVRWRIPVHGGYAGPAVAAGKVYVMDFKRAPEVAGPDNPFAQGAIPGTERVVCVDARDGTVLWTHAYPCVYTVSYAAGPRVTPTVSEGKVYALGAEGHFFCLDANSGEVLWQRLFHEDYGVKTPMWGFAGHPLVHGDKVICLVGGKGSVAVAFDKETGKERWRALTAKEPGYCPPTLIEADGRKQLILWHPESINALNPDTGDLYWSEAWNIRSGLAVPTPRQQGDLLFLTSFYNGRRFCGCGPSPWGLSRCGRPTRRARRTPPICTAS
jgi:outer membrane protein assembly factor BamB